LKDLYKKRKSCVFVKHNQNKTQLFHERRNPSGGKLRTNPLTWAHLEW